MTMSLAGGGRQSGAAPWATGVSPSTLLIGAVLGIAALVRFWDLLALPLFVDESFWLRWAMNPDWYLPDNAGPIEILRVSLIAEQQPPLLHWLLLPLMPWVGQPVLVARMIPAAFGVVAVLGTYLLTREILGSRAAVCAALVHALLPMAVFFDRIVHHDALAASFAVLVAWASVRLARQPSSRWAVITGLLLVLGLVSKTQAVLVAPAPVLAALLFGRRSDAAALFRSLLFTFALVVLLAPISFLGLPPDETGEKVFGFALTPAEVLAMPWELWETNFIWARSWQEGYLGWPLTEVAAAGAVVMLMRQPRASVYMLVLWVLLTVPFVIAGRQIYSRYMAISVFPWAVCAGYLAVAAGALAAGSARRARLPGADALSALSGVAVLGYALLPMASTLTGIVTAPLSVRLPDSDRSQYQTGPYAGLGTREAAAFLAEEARREPIVFLREDHMPGSAIFFYSRDTANVHHAWEPNLAFNRNQSVPRVRRWLEQDRPVYFVWLLDQSGPTDVRTPRLQRALQQLPEARQVAEFKDLDSRTRFVMFRMSGIEGAEARWP